MLLFVNRGKVLENGMSIVNSIKRLFENYYGGKIIGGSMGTSLMLLVYKKRYARIYLVPV
jgi:hypothetical protein